MKKFLSMALAAVLMLSLTACAGNAGTDGQSTQTPAQQSAAPESTAPANGAGEGQTPAGIQGEGDVLVVYFSATGNTKQAATLIAEMTGGDLFALEPVQPYSDADLDYNDDGSRVSQEYADESLRDVALVADTVDNWQDVSVVYIGYPIWWGVAAWPVNTFVEANDFTGKTVIPFCTSASSGLGRSGELLAELAGSGNWLQGHRFSSRVSEQDVRSWLDTLGQ